MMTSRTLIPDRISKSINPRFLPVVHLLTLLLLLFRLLLSSVHSDVSLTSSDATTFPAHLAILHGYTDFFDTALSSKFAESSSRIVSFREHSSAAVKSFLEFCYTGEYASQAHIDVIQFADYLLASDLRVYAINQLITKFNGDNDEARKARKEELPELVDVVFSGGGYGEDIKQLVINAAFKGLKEEGGDFLNPFREVMKLYGEFSAGVLMNVAMVGPWTTGDAVYQVDCHDCNKRMTDTWQWDLRPEKLPVCPSHGPKSWICIRQSD